MEEQSGAHADAVERMDRARDERDRRSEQRDAASGSPGELAAAAELEAAEDQFAAREAWVKWVERGQ